MGKKSSDKLQMTQDNQEWCEKVYLLDSSRFAYLTKSAPSISSKDLLDSSFLESLLRKTRAVSINLKDKDFAKYKGYDAVEIRGGDFMKYFHHEVPVLIQEVMPIEFSRFLITQGLPHVRASDYTLVKNTPKPVFKAIPEAMWNHFWLRKIPTASQLRAICEVPYVLDLSMFVEYNHTPAVEAWIEESEEESKT